MEIKKHIPNAITSFNLFFGTLAVIFAFKGMPVYSVYLVMASAVCDFFDGFAARLLNTYSPMGKELDSLADLISFGLAPSVLLYCRMEGHEGWQVITYIPLLITVASALRLAKFNIDKRQSENFIGLPTPANALMICMFLHFSSYNTTFDNLLDTEYFIPVVSLALSYLLISEIPMFSLKFKSLKWEGNEKRFILIICILVLFILGIILGKTWSLSLFIVFCIYLIINIYFYLISLFKK